MGGAIGVLFYLGTTIAASMYVLGAVEAFQTGFSFTDVFTFDVQVMSPFRRDNIFFFVDFSCDAVVMSF